MRTENLIHPGEILREEFMSAFNISPASLSNSICVPESRIIGIINEKRRISTELAIRLGIYFKTGAEFWINLQSYYDIGVLTSRKYNELSQIKAMA